MRALGGVGATGFLTRSLSRGEDTASFLRRGVLALAFLGIAGTTVELVFLHHWTKATQLIVWPAIAALGAAFLLLVVRPGPRRVLSVRAIAALVVLVAGAGVLLHVLGNLDAGPLDQTFGSRWASMSALDQWIAAIIGDVGPAPALAPGVLAEISLALVLATIHHPALRRRRHADDRDSLIG